MQEKQEKEASVYEHKRNPKVLVDGQNDTSKIRKRNLSGKIMRTFGPTTPGKNVKARVSFTRGRETAQSQGQDVEVTLGEIKWYQDTSSIGRTRTLHKKFHLKEGEERLCEMLTGSPGRFFREKKTKTIV